jgi:hypothetical protein
MHTRKIRRYFVIPVIYLAVIFGLLYLQFSGTLTVRRSIGDLRFVGTLVAGEDETSQDITAARVAFQGLVFIFSQDKPVLLRSGDSQGSNPDTDDTGDDVQILVPRRYEITDDTLEIFFSDESLIRFEVSVTEPVELHVIPTGTEAWPRDARLVIPWDTEADLVINQPNPATPDTLDITVEEERFFFLSMPPRSEVNRKEGFMEVPAMAGSRLIRYAQRVDSEISVIETAFSRNRRQISDDFYSDAVDRYISVAFQGWASTRFNGGSGTWDMRTGSPRFSEEILTAYLAEAWRRDQYTTAFNQMRRAADQHPNDVGFLSATFLGNLREVTDRFVAQDQQRALSLAGRVSTGDVTVFREEDLIPFAALRGNEALYRNVINLIRTVDYREVDIKTAVGMVTSLVDVNHPAPASREAVQRFQPIIEERIIPSIRQFDDLFFLESAQGEIDVWYSIRAGILLERYGRDQGNILYVTIGRNLVLSGLQLADNRGFLPQLIFFGDQGMERQEGSFGPEAIYRPLAANPAYPRMISLYDELGAGSFVWTIANFTRIDVRPQQYSFRLRYPPNRTHYIIMHGIPPFQSMILFGLQWRNDPTFELYIKGRHYEPRTETLMIKYTDNSTEGDITLFY